jgi:uncharacterized protein (DUF2461 family)
MTKATNEKFTGFIPETIDFLTSLRKNNNKSWFESHRKDYENFLFSSEVKAVFEKFGFTVIVE